MSFPSGVLTRIVTVGPFPDLAGQNIDGLVQVQIPSPLKWAATGAILMNTVESIQLGADGTGSIELPIIQAGFVTGPDDAAVGFWTYLFTPILEPNSGDIIPSKYIELGIGDGTPYHVDFAAVSSNDHGVVAYLPGGKGETGDKGDTGPAPVISQVNATALPYGQSPTASITGGPDAYIITLGIPAGQPGANGSAAGVPVGGTTGQVLTKTSNTDFATQWADNAAQGIPAGGTTGQMLVKVSGTDYVTGWQDIPKQLPNGGTAGQVLKKITNTDQDFGWGDVPFELPVGGTTGQVLAKKSAADRDVQWANPSTGGGGTSLPAGGTTGQILKKNSNTDGDAGWGTPTFDYNSLPPGVKIRVNWSSTTGWPARPSARADLTFVWTAPRGTALPPVVSSGTGGMLDNVDEVAVLG